MRQVVILLLLGLTGLKVSAQNKAVDDLKFLFVDEKYEKCIYKAEKYSDNDKYKKDPLIYVYAAMAYFEIAKNPDKYEEDYAKSPLKNALKYAYKFTKKDKEKEHVGEYMAFLNALKDSTNKLAQTYYLTDDYRKSNYFYRKIEKYDPEDAVVKLWVGITYYKNRNIGGSRIAFEEAMKQIKPGYEPNETIRGVLPFGLKEYAELMKEQGEHSKANDAKKLFEDYKKYDPDIIDAKKMEERKKKAQETEKIIRKFQSEEEFEEDDD